MLFLNGSQYRKIKQLFVMQNAACKKKVLLSYIEKTSHLINVFDFDLPGDGSYGKLKDLR